MQTGTKPQWIPLEERSEYDVVELTKHTIAKDLGAVSTDGYLKKPVNIRAKVVHHIKENSNRNLHRRLQRDMRIFF